MFGPSPHTHPRHHQRHEQQKNAHKKCEVWRAAVAAAAPVAPFGTRFDIAAAAAVRTSELHILCMCTLSPYSHGNMHALIISVRPGAKIANIARRRAHQHTKTALLSIYSFRRLMRSNVCVREFECVCVVFRTLSNARGMRWCSTVFARVYHVSARISRWASKRPRV